MPEYHVTGPFPFGDHAPDSTFEADPNEQIERAVKRGSISPAEKPATPVIPAETATREAPASPAPSATTDTSPKSSAPHAGHAGDHKKKE